jgi:hypothetical protein
VLQGICAQQQIHVILQKIYHLSAGRTPIIKTEQLLKE